MPDLRREDLDAKIKSDPIGIYLLCGEEAFLVKAYTDRLVKASVDDSFKDFNLHIIENEIPDLSEVYDLSMSVPMMAESKCVVVKNYPVESADDSNLGQLKELLKDNPEDNCLIFTYPALTPSGKQFTAMTKLFAQYGYVVKFSKQTERDLVVTLERGAKKRGAAFEKGVALYMVQSVGNDLNLLQNELEKVCAHCDGTIRAEDVDAVCIKSLYNKTFDMTKALVSGNFDRAFRLLEKLFEQREDEYLVLGAVISQYTDLYRAKSAFAAGKSVGEIAEAYPSMYKGREFKLTNIKNISIGMTFEELSDCLEILAQADNKLKFTSEDKKLILENTLVRLARAKGK